MSVECEIQEVIILSFLFKAETSTDLTNMVKGLKGAYFTNPENRDILFSFQELSKRSLEFDRVTFNSIHNKSTGYSLTDEKIDEFLSISDINNFEYYKTEIIRSYFKQQLKYTDLSGDTPSEIMSSLQDCTIKLRSQLESEGDSNIYTDQEMVDMMNNHFDELKNDPPMIPTYIKSLDSKLTEGFRRGNVSIWVARSSTGKTTFINNVVSRHAIYGKYKILYLPVEMGTVSVSESIAAAKAKIPISNVVRGDISDKDHDKLKNSFDDFINRHNNIKFSDTIRTINDLESQLVANDYDVVIVDLFERLKDIKIDPGAISEALSRIQNLAAETDTHIALVHQIRRSNNKRDKAPNRSEVKNSGAYEEVADLLVAFHRFPFIYDGDKIEVIQSIIMKQRKGERDVSVYNKFDSEYLRILGEINMYGEESESSNRSVDDIFK